MIEKTYKCDVCNERTAEQELIGIHFVSGRVWELGRAAACQRHVCLSCVDRIRHLDASAIPGLANASKLAEASQHPSRARNAADATPAALAGKRAQV